VKPLGAETDTELFSQDVSMIRNCGVCDGFSLFTSHAPDGVPVKVCNIVCSDSKGPIRMPMNVFNEIQGSDLPLHSIIGREVYIAHSAWVGDMYVISKSYQMLSGPPPGGSF
jgi:hypothetical protein